MTRLRHWLTGLLVGLLLSGGIFAATNGGHHLFIRDDGLVDYNANSAATAFRVCGDASEDNCPINAYVHATKGPVNEPICTGGPCDPLLEIPSGKTFTIAQIDGDAGIKVAYSEIGAFDMLERATDPTDPTAASGRWKLYFKSTGLFVVGDDGTPVGPLGTGGGGGPQVIRPASAIPSASGAYSCVMNGIEWMCVTDATSLTADVTWQLKFNLPSTLSSGCTLVVDLMTEAAPGTQVISIRPEWNTWAYGATRASLTLNSETVTPTSVSGNAGSGDTIGLTSADEDQLLKATWTLDASTETAGQPIAMNIVAVNATHTLGVPFGMDPYLICE